MKRFRVSLSALAVVLAAATVVRGQGPTTYTFSTLAGSGTAGLSDGTGAAASFTSPRRLAYFGGLIWESDAMLVRTVTPAGVVKKLAQLPDVTRGIGLSGDVAYVLAGCGVARVTRDGVVTTLAGSLLSIGPGACGSADGDGSAARFNLPAGITGGGSYVADTGNSTIRSFGLSFTGFYRAFTISGVAGSPGAADGLGTEVRFREPGGVVGDANVGLYIADTGNHTIRYMDGRGNVVTLAGLAGIPGSADGTGTAARFNQPTGLALATNGDLIIADSGNSTIRRLVRSGSIGTVSTIAGSAGVAGLADGPAANARFNGPQGIALDDVGTIYVGDTGNHVIRVGVLGTPAAPSITTQPSDVTTRGGQNVQFTTAAIGNPSPGFQWQVSTNGVTWSDLSETTPYGGVRTRTLTIQNTPASLNGRRYRATIGNTTGSVLTNEALLTVNAIVVSPGSLRFAAAKNGAAGDITASTPPQEVAVTLAGQTSTWTASANQSWLQITGANGSGSGRFTVTLVNPGNVIAGNTGLTATITVTTASGLVATIPVTLSVDLTSPRNPPFGSFDTPANNANGLQGSVAVTGWALDDIGVDHVEIWRDAAPGETTPVFTGAGPGNGKIFVGNAAFVSGARPDVEGAYPTMPNAQRAGWGYLLLTYGLWNQGNGPFRFYAFAIDVDGSSVTLGIKDVTVSNASATKPFGAIDTPASGGTATGTVVNFGWALTPGTTCSIANPNVQVSLDSGPLTPVIYGQARTDVAAAFPGYTNAAAAGGHYILDTTALTDGVHTIGWVATDSCGRSEGMGSRFFTVANGGSAVTTTQVWPASLAVSASPTRVVRIAEGERTELQLPRGAPYLARQVVNGTTRELPVGSTFDAAEAKFYWQPAAGFLGAYDLEFNADSDVEKVRVVVGPPIRMAIDTPRAGNVLSASGFTLAGWAVDLASLDGAGIDTLHVWAYPVGGGDPVFVGAARGTGRRPDVARLYGEAFASAGFTLNGALAPGTYDLVVYAHSAASNSFAGSETVRVVVR